MKYTDAKVTFAEIPDEISLCINISECLHKCEGCHSPELREDIGKPLDWGSLNALIHINNGISCVSFMGGDRYPKMIDRLARNVKRLGLKTAWYSGNDFISSDIDVNNFDYIKIGPYMKEKGPLDNPDTNQVMYKVEHILDEGHNSFQLINITSRFYDKSNR